MREIIAIIEEAFRQKAMGKTEAPPKPGVHPKQDAFIHAMPAYLAETKSAGVKWVSGFPGNPARGLPYISGLLILNDVETGFPISVMDASWITAKRTGAATAVAAEYLARGNSSTFGILGCGAQGRSNLEALLTACKNLTSVRAYDISRDNLSRYVDEMTSEFGVEVVPVGSPREAVEECDVVVTAGPILKHPRPVIEPSWVEDGTFACALDFDSYWKPEAMRAMDKFCTDDEEQMDYYRTQGYFGEIPRVYADLAEIVSGQRNGREKASERIMCMNLGLAIEDIAVAKLVYDKALKGRVGTELPL